MMGWEIKVTHVYPPIPIRSMDFLAYYDGQEESGSGFGATPAEAVLDLVDQDIVMWMCESPRCNVWNGIT